MSQHKINIILLNWNGWKDTINCVNSLQELKCTDPFNIIVIDNWSSDDSVERIQSACPQVELIQNDDNFGFGGGCNVGLHRSISDDVEFVWLLNNDTTVFSNSLQELLNIARSNPNTGIIGSVLYHMDNSETIQAWGGGRINFWTGSVKYIQDSKDSSKLQYITGASMLIRVNALREVGMFDDTSYFMYFEDADLCFRFVKKDWGLAVAEDSIILHKESASLRNKSYLLIRYFNQSAVVFFCKHYRFCLIPVFTGLGGRLVKRFIYKDFDGIKEILIIFRQQIAKLFLRTSKQ